MSLASLINITGWCNRTKYENITLTAQNRVFVYEQVFCLILFIWALTDSLFSNPAGTGAGFGCIRPQPDTDQRRDPETGVGAGFNMVDGKIKILENRMQSQI
jgi:hypothetical protein